MKGLLRIGMGGVAVLVVLSLLFKLDRRLGRFVLLSGMTWFLVAKLWLPRAAHKAFLAGKTGRAKFYYLLLGWLRFDRTSRAQILISRSACFLKERRFSSGARLLGLVSHKSLDESSKSVWLNNRAYLYLSTEKNLEAALSMINEALAMRPFVPGFLHTKGLILMSLGKKEDALVCLERIASFDHKWVGDDLESARCHDLGLAWRGLGHPDYARDYFRRASYASPNSIWSKQAALQLETY